MSYFVVFCLGWGAHIAFLNRAEITAAIRARIGKQS